MKKENINYKSLTAGQIQQISLLYMIAEKEVRNVNKMTQRVVYVCV